MNFRNRYSAVPNRLIDDTVMHYTAKIVYLALALMQRRNGHVKITAAKLTALTGLCGDTVLQSLRELEVCGFLKKKRNLRWSQEHGGLIYCANLYKLSRNFSAGYTLISAKLMDFDITPAGFAVLLYLYRCAGRTGRAFPSLRRIAGTQGRGNGSGLDMSKSTVLRVLKDLAARQAFLKNPCNTTEGDQSCNSYYLTDMVPAKIEKSPENAQHSPENFFASEGGSIFPGAYNINKITGVLTGRKGSMVEVNFAASAIYPWLSWRERPCYWDGEGVKVSTVGVPSDLLT